MGYNKNRGLNFGLVMPKSKKIIWVYFISVTIPLFPFISLGAGDLKKEYAAAAVSTRDLLNPDKWFEVLKRNITIPISKEQVIKIPTPEESLKQSAPKLKEIGRGVKEETGVDLAKFIGWFAKVLRLFFQIVVDLLDTVAKSFG